MHANLPELAQRWERDYAGGGLARLPQALTTDDTVGKQMIEMGTASGDALDKQTAFLPSDERHDILRTLDNQVQEDLFMNEQNKKQYQDLLRQDKEGFDKGEWDLSLDQKRYVSNPNHMTDARYVNDVDAGIAGLSTDVFEPPAYETFSPNYTEGTDFGNTNFFGEPVIDEVVSRSFKDHDNLKSWLDANPNMGENIKRKAKDFYEGGVETIGNIWQGGKDKASWLKDAAMTGIGKAINFPIGLMANAFPNPLSSGSRNYNPRLRGQIDYLGGALGTRSSPYQFRSGKGSSVLAGKNLVSGFGTNDYGQMLQKRIDYFNKFKEKRGLTIAQNKKLQDTIREKAAADKQRMEAQLAAYSGPTNTHSYDPGQNTSGGSYSGRGGSGSGPQSGSYGPWG